MSNAVPVFEAKNKLPLYIHQAEQEGPVILSRHNKEVAVLISIEEFNQLLEDRKAYRKKLNIVERARLFRERHKELYEGEDIGEEFCRILEENRNEPKVINESNCWDEVLESWK